MIYSLYAFIPVCVLIGIAFISGLISLWPGGRRPDIALAPKQPRPSAEILHFPSRREPAATASATRSYRNG